MIKRLETTVFILATMSCSQDNTLTTASDLNTAAGKVCHISSAVVNFRAKACLSDECTILGKLMEGTAVTLTGSSEISPPPENINFLSVAHNNINGWVAESLLDCSEHYVPPVISSPDGSQLVVWAYAPPSRNLDEIRNDFQKIKASGANGIYIGHANPGEVDDFWPSEIGMTFSVWNALYGYPHDTGGRAEEIFARVRATLDVAREVNFKVILAVGYQIQMGRYWNDKNPGALRRNPDGSLMYHWQTHATASPYSSAFRSSITQYYNWVNENLVKPYPNVVGLNLADEPMGSDFSAAAQTEFARRYNGRALLGNDSDNGLRGDFLSGVIADYAEFTANSWLNINPRLWVTMTFHFQRDLFWFPSMEKIFAKNLPNFVVSTDTHYHDAPADTQPMHLGLLHNLVKNMALLSKCYNKKIMLWSSANSWGLTPNGNADMARENLRIVRDWPQRFGARSLAYLFWGFNIPHQGLFSDAPGGFPGQRDGIWSALTEATPSLFQAMNSRGAEVPSKLYLMSLDRLNEKFGAEKTPHLAYPHLFDWGRVQGELKDTSAVIMVDGECTKKIITEKVYLY